VRERFNVPSLLSRIKIYLTVFENLNLKSATDGDKVILLSSIRAIYMSILIQVGSPHHSTLEKRKIA
jgi:hypothetical protein